MRNTYGAKDGTAAEMRQVMTERLGITIQNEVTTGFQQGFVVVNAMATGRLNICKAV